MSIYSCIRSKETLQVQIYEMRSPIMAENFEIIVTVTLLCFCFIVSKCERDSYDTTVLYRICNDALHCPTLSPFGRAVDHAVNDLVFNTENHGFDYYSSSVIDEVGAYGHAECNGELSKMACELCLTAAYFKLDDYCKTTIGAQIQLKDCRLRYENYPFIE